METFDLNRLLSEVAVEHATTPEKVRQGIVDAIIVAWNNPDPEVHAIWKAMSPHGECPTVEEALLYLSAMVATEELMITERREEKPLDYNSTTISLIT